MTITSIATHVEPGLMPELEASLAAPMALAEAFNAGLTALVFPAEVAVATATVAEWDLAAREDAAAAHLRAVAERRGIRCEVRARSSFAYGAGEVFADQLKVSDLGVLTVGRAPGIGQRLLLEAAVFDSGRPVLLAPATPPFAALPGRVAVAWDATPAAVRAVHGALPFIRRGAETVVVTVTDDKEPRPGQSGIELARLLARHGARAEVVATRRGSGGVLQALAALAGEREAGLLVMGAVRHAALRNLVFGSATRDLLERGPSMPVLLSA
jgi:nucleotide-binding universal stress UspA family protein